MDIKDKIITALREPLNAAFIRLDDDDGISGFVVSASFERMSTLDRQTQIEDALNKAPTPLKPEERHQILMIAGLTPAEYDAVGANVMIHKVKKAAGGKIEIFVQGGFSDAEYVRGATNSIKSVQTTEPKLVETSIGAIMSFYAEGSKANPLTKDKVINILKRQSYLSVMPGAERGINTG